MKIFGGGKNTGGEEFTEMLKRIVDAQNSTNMSLERVVEGIERVSEMQTGAIIDMANMITELSARVSCLQDVIVNNGLSTDADLEEKVSATTKKIIDKKGGIDG